MSSLVDGKRFVTWCVEHDSQRGDLGSICQVREVEAWGGPIAGGDLCAFHQFELRQIGYEKIKWGGDDEH